MAMVALQTRGRKLLALALPLLLVATGVVVPTLDRDLFTDGPVLEAEHHPSTCPVAHDHTLCSQAGAGRWLLTEPPSPRLSFRRVLPSLRPASHPPFMDRDRHSSHPRAPPRG